MDYYSSSQVTYFGQSHVVCHMTPDKQMYQPVEQFLFMANTSPIQSNAPSPSPFHLQEPPLLPRFPPIIRRCINFSDQLPVLSPTNESANQLPILPPTRGQCSPQSANQFSNQSPTHGQCSLQTINQLPILSPTQGQCSLRSVNQFSSQSQKPGQCSLQTINQLPILSPTRGQCSLQPTNELPIQSPTRGQYSLQTNDHLSVLSPKYDHHKLQSTKRLAVILPKPDKQCCDNLPEVSPKPDRRPLKIVKRNIFGNTQDTEEAMVHRDSIGSARITSEYSPEQIMKPKRQRKSRKSKPISAEKKMRKNNTEKERIKRLGMAFDILKNILPPTRLDEACQPVFPKTHYEIVQGAISYMTALQQMLE